ncbi:MAG: ribonuclease III [Candidatus Delongbacteria bacterium]|nr:ribonuclease III [Candidatus Delongbacteria bacterium]MBN2836553.1 ribonuclease III [Candidatus Delongbacteria bacterium]
MFNIGKKSIKDIISDFVCKLLFRKADYRRVSKLSGHNIEELLARINYRFTNPDLLEMALKHRSYQPEEGYSFVLTNERLEFLGDSVLALIVADFMYKNFPNMSEGELTQRKSAVVSGLNLCEAAKRINLGNHLILSDSEEKSGGRMKESLLENAFEALIGAIYLDSGIENAKKFVTRILLEFIDNVDEIPMMRNYKSELMEYLQGIGLHTPIYKLISEDGPEHDKIFSSVVVVNGVEAEIGSGKSRKKAEKEAAMNTLNCIEANPEYINRFKK